MSRKAMMALIKKWLKDPEAILVNPFMVNQTGKILADLLSFYQEKE